MSILYILHGVNKLIDGCECNRATVTSQALHDNMHATAERDGSKGEIVYPDVYEFIDGWLALMSQLMDTRPDSWRAVQ